LLKLGDIDGYGKTFKYHWELKQKLSENISDSEIDNLIEDGIKYGALGGKLIGAGGGGFIMFYTNKNHSTLITRMEHAGLTYMPFEFVYSGVSSNVIA
jgi:D-glycero-alpha-D-manno-heptose-7-phosphate kinase